MMKMFETISLLITTLCISTSIAENHNFYTRFGLGAPINVAGEQIYGLDTSYSTGSIGTTQHFGAGTLSGLSNGYGYGGSSLGYGTVAYPALNRYGTHGYGVNPYHDFNSYNSFNQHGILHHSKGSYAGESFGGNFYPGSRFLGAEYGGYHLKKPFHSEYGVSSYGAHTTDDIEAGSPLLTGYTGVTGNVVGYGGNYGSEYGYGVHQLLK